MNSLVSPWIVANKLFISSSFPGIVNEDNPEEALTYGSTPYYTPFPFPPLLMTYRNLRIEDFTRVCRKFYDWLTFNPQWRLFLPTLLDSWPHGSKFVRTRFEAVRLLTKAQFFMRHPTHEATSRGEWSSTESVMVSFLIYMFSLVCAQVTCGISGHFSTELLTSSTTFRTTMKKWTRLVFDSRLTSHVTIIMNPLRHHRLHLPRVLSTATGTVIIFNYFPAFDANMIITDSCYRPFACLLRFMGKYANKAWNSFLLDSMCFEEIESGSVRDPLVLRRENNLHHHEWNARTHNRCEFQVIHVFLLHQFPDSHSKLILFTQIRCCKESSCLEYCWIKSRIVHFRKFAMIGMWILWKWCHVH